MHSTNSANTDRNRKGKGHSTFMIVQSNPILILLLKGASSEECQVLHVLWRALPGHHLQHHNAEEDAVLHSQSDHPLHGHLLPHYPCVLSSLWQRGEGYCQIQDFQILSPKTCPTNPDADHWPSNGFISIPARYLKLLSIVKYFYFSQYLHTRWVSPSPSCSHSPCSSSSWLRSFPPPPSWSPSSANLSSSPWSWTPSGNLLSSS